MLDPFAMALDAIFNAPGSENALYIPGAGTAAALRLVRRGPDRLARFGDVHVQGSTHAVDIRRSDVARPMLGDRFLIGDLDLTITVEPLLDVEGLTWTCGAEVTA